MCISASTAAMMALSGVGSLMQYKAQQDALDKQDQIATQEAMRQLDYQDQANREVIGHLEENYDPTRRKEARDAIAEERTDYLKGILAPQAPEGGDAFGEGYVGDVSDRYTASRASSVANEMERAANLAALLGKTQAPSYLRQNEAISAGDLATQLGLNAGDAASSARSASLRAQSVRPNAMMSGLGSAISGTAAGLSAGMAGAAPSAAGQVYTTTPQGMIINIPTQYPSGFK